MGKIHWTQTPEGRKRMSKIQKLSREKMKQVKKRKYVKKVVNGSGAVVVTISGRDTRQALSELLSNVQYDNLDVTVSVRRGK